MNTAFFQGWSGLASSGAKLMPSRFFGKSSPTSSPSVGTRSTNSTNSRQTLPLAGAPGTRTHSGARRVASSIEYFDQKPWSPRWNP